MQACLAQSTVREQEGPGTRTHREGGAAGYPRAGEGTTGKMLAWKRSSLVLSRARREAVGQRT